MIHAHRIKHTTSGIPGSQSRGPKLRPVSILGTIRHSLRYLMNIYQSLGAVSGAKDTKMAAQASPQVVGKLMGDLHRYPETKLL